MKNTIDFSQYDLFIVDFDGTIVDTMTMWRDICPNFIRSVNKVPDSDVYLKITSKTNLEIARYIRDTYLTEYTYEEVTYMFFEFIKEQYIKQNLKPNAIKLLEELNRNGKTVLFSASAGMVLDVLLDKYNLRKYFNNIYSGSDLGLTKKDGSGYLEVIRCEGGSEKALVLEDALHAIIGARTQNLDVLGILDISNRSKLEELQKNCTYLLDLETYK